MKTNVPTNTPFSYTDDLGNVWTTATTVKPDCNYNCVRVTVCRPDGKSHSEFAQKTIFLSMDKWAKLAEFARGVGA